LIAKGRGSWGGEADFSALLINAKQLWSKWRFFVWVKREQTTTTVEIQAGKAGRRWMVVTLGILPCAQNDGKDLLAARTMQEPWQKQTNSNNDGDGAPDRFVWRDFASGDSKQGRCGEKANGGKYFWQRRSEIDWHDFFLGGWMGAKICLPVKTNF
jgi:hypothetical protein